MAIIKNDISTNFNGWPLTGKDLDIEKRHFVAYPYDPGFSPAATTPTVTRRINFQSGFFEPFFLEGDSYVATEDGVRVTGFDTLKNPNYSATNVAGAARPGRAIWGKQYWEVQILQLPNEVPPETVFTHEKGFNGTPQGGLFWLTTATNKLHWYPFSTSPSSIPDPSSLFGEGKIVCSYPPAPVGGKVTIDSPTCKFEIEGSAFDSNGNYTETVTVTLKWPRELDTFLNPVIGLWPRCNQFGRNNIIGLDDPGAQYRSIGVTRLSVMQGQLTFSLDDANDGLFGGAQGGDVASSSGLSWLPDTSITHLYGDLFRAPNVNTPPRNEFGSLVGLEKGDCANIGDGGVPLLGIGRSGPVFKGRADMLRSTIPDADEPINTGGPFAEPSGIWTGVDLGDWGVGDTIMLATDATSRKVWFGKNGQWFPGANPSTGSGWACLMDGPANARNYFPGVSFRYGPSHVRAIFDKKKLQYPIPTGFKSFAARYA